MSGLLLHGIRPGTTLPTIPGTTYGTILGIMTAGIGVILGTIVLPITIRGIIVRTTITIPVHTTITTLATPIIVLPPAHRAMDVFIGLDHAEVRLVSEQDAARVQGVPIRVAIVVRRV